jgi:hypothetical protein
MKRITYIDVWLHLSKGGKNSKRVIGVKGSKESPDVPKNSPVKPFRGY